MQCGDPVMAVLVFVLLEQQYWAVVDSRICGLWNLFTMRMDSDTWAVYGVCLPRVWGGGALVDGKPTDRDCFIIVIRNKVL